jgi:hypothetical protein
MLDTYLKWFRAHERLLLVLSVSVLAGYGFNRWVDVSANNAKAQASIAAATQAATDKTTATLKAQVDAQAAQFALSQAEMKQEILSLVSAIAQRDAQTQTRIVQVEQPKTPSQAVTDLQSAYTNLPAPVLVTDAGATVPTSDLQLFTVTKIEGDTCSADLKDTKSELVDSQTTVAQSEGLIASLQGEVKQDAVDLKAHDAAAAQALKAEKAVARKSKFHSFLAGAATAGAILLRFVRF